MNEVSKNDFENLGFEIAHIGINTDSEKSALGIACALAKAFGFEVKNGNSSVFSDRGIEIMKNMYLGKNGHIAIRTNNIGMAIEHLEANGFPVDLVTAKYDNDCMKTVYLKDEIGGFAVHLLQK